MTSLLQNLRADGLPVLASSQKLGRGRGRREEGGESMSVEGSLSLCQQAPQKPGLCGWGPGFVRMGGVCCCWSPEPVHDEPGCLETILSIASLKKHFWNDFYRSIMTYSEAHRSSVYISMGFYCAPPSGKHLEQSRTPEVTSCPL